VSPEEDVPAPGRRTPDRTAVATFLNWEFVATKTSPV